jgi:hypothetical protein
MEEKFLEGKFLIGDDFDVPMEIIKVSENVNKPVIHGKDGITRDITFQYYESKVFGGGKAMRVTQET